MSTDQLERVKHTRDRALSARADFLARLERDSKGRENRQLTPDEDRLFRSLTEEIRDAQQRVVELEQQEQYATRPSDGARITAQTSGSIESRVYQPGGRNSYFRDLVQTSRQTADAAAHERLAEYGREVRDLNRADATGGSWVPPAYLLDQTIGLPRAGRVTADLLAGRTLPGGTDTISIPKIMTGTATAIQPADNDPVQELDLTESMLTAPVRTIAGQQDVAQQLIDQSPINVDDLIARDLRASFNQQLDNQVLSGSGVAGQLLGLRNVVGIEAVSWTSATPTAVGLIKRVADAQSRISSALFEPANVVIMHPRRWAWLLTQNDSSSRR